MPEGDGVADRNVLFFVLFPTISLESSSTSGPPDFTWSSPGSSSAVSAASYTIVVPVVFFSLFGANDRSSTWSFVFSVLSRVFS